MSNRRRLLRVCSVEGCGREATVSGMTFADGEAPGGPTTWWCERHAVGAVHSFRGKVWGDSQCTCGQIHDIVSRAGRRVEGFL